ncbi:conjugative transposon protein TraJ [Pinibacter soli]|uniref:Conjugative transposon protein TraJ n=1 Tax=Pinibacter soli TaxID=3044211 RepID=A0ABT6RHC3_9BACT|nr:conjugative transposon protein TraJ [Pinibacter soli]MDI3321969.1 conjugative transposon protein TraJ [Pinibacter soli]
MLKYFRVVAGIAVLCVTPHLLIAQDLGDNIHGLQSVLENVYNEVMPLCSKLIVVSQLIAGFGALWYIGSRIWKHIANAEPIDFFPLLRPFAIGLAIMLFPHVIDLINGIMTPTVTATYEMTKDSKKAITSLLKEKQQVTNESQLGQLFLAGNGIPDPDKWHKYMHDDNSSETGIGEDMKYAWQIAQFGVQGMVKQWLSEILQFIFQAASLVIDTLRTFQLIVLAILGPLAFGFSVFDGFQHTLKAWLARYLNVFLWLPVANIFGSIIGKIQENMIKLDIVQIQSTGDTYFGATDIAYLIFLLIGIIGYFSVPSITNHIIHAGGDNGLTKKVTTMVSTAVSNGVSAVYGGTQALAQGLSGSSSGVSNSNQSSNSMGGGSNSQGSNYMRDKISGN